MKSETTPPTEQAIALVLPIIDLLVARKYDEVAMLSRGRLKASCLREEAESYPGTFVSDASESAKSIRIDPVCDGEWLVDMYLCSVEDGRTQLALRCVLERSGAEFVALPWDLLVP